MDILHNTRQIYRKMQTMSAIEPAFCRKSCILLRLTARNFSCIIILANILTVQKKGDHAFEPDRNRTHAYNPLFPRPNAPIRPRPARLQHDCPRRPHRGLHLGRQGLYAACKASPEPPAPCRFFPGVPCHGPGLFPGKSRPYRGERAHPWPAC